MAKRVLMDVEVSRITDPLKGAGRSAEPIESVAELADSIARGRLIQPVILRKVAEGAYEIMVGRRRLRAVRHLGRGMIEAIVGDCEDTGLLIGAWEENFQRKDLTAVEEARLMRQGMEMGVGLETMAVRWGRSREWVEARINLLELPEDVITALERGFIGMGVAVVLGGVADVGVRGWLIRSAIADGCTVRVAQGWVATYWRTEEEGALEPPAGTPARAAAAAATTGALSPGVLVRPCSLCRAGGRAEEMVYMPVCRACFRAAADAHAAAEAVAAGAEPPAETVE